MSGKNILLIAALDTKGEEADYIRRVIEKMGCKVITADIGVLGEAKIKPDISRYEIAMAGGSSIEDLVRLKDEGLASQVMAKGLTKIAKKLCNEKKIRGLIAIGGSWGTATSSTVMQALPVGIPKIIVSTMASRDVRQYVGIRDITLMHSVVDIFGLNRITKKILGNAAAAIAGTANFEIERENEKPLVGISLTGEQFVAAEKIKKSLEGNGYEVVFFHAVGSGGKALEDMVRSGEIDGGVIDLAVQEIYANLYDPGGMFDAGPHRLESPGEVGLLHIIVPGCADFMSFSPGMIPRQFEKYKRHMHNPAVIAVKTGRKEISKLADVLCEKINKGKGPRAVIVPMGGFSRYDKIDSPAGFYDPKIRQILVKKLKEKLDPSVRYVEVDVHINDPELAETVTKVFLELAKMKVSGEISKSNLV